MRDRQFDYIYKIAKEEKISRHGIDNLILSHRIWTGEIFKKMGVLEFIHIKLMQKFKFLIPKENVAYDRFIN